MPPSTGARATATGNWTARSARSGRNSATDAATPETPRPHTPRYATAAAPWLRRYGIDQDSADRFSRLPAGTTYEQWKAGKAESAHGGTGRTMGEFMQSSLVQKQLAKRGLTEAQGRKLLSEQLKADGATGHQFRTMTKQQQRKAWNGALKSIELQPLGGFTPKGMANTTTGKAIARGMAKRLGTCADDGIKALYRKYAQEFVLNDGGVGSADLFLPNKGHVLMDTKRAMRGDAINHPYEASFHEFGHMIDWLSSGKSGFTSKGSNLVKAMDADWNGYLKKNFVRPKVDDLYDSISKKAVIAEVRSFAQGSGNWQVSRLANDALEAQGKNGLKWNDVFDKLMDDGGFSSAYDEMLDSIVESQIQNNSLAANEYALKQLRKRFSGEKGYVYGDLSDMLQGATGIHESLGIGHEAGYFQGIIGDENRATEFFAEVCSAKVMNPESLALIQEFFPSALSEFEGIVKEMLTW